MNHIDVKSLEGAAELRAPRFAVSGGRRLRVALVTGSYACIADGVALTLNRLVAYLLTQDVDVLVFTPMTARPAFAHQGEVVRAPSAPLPLRPEYRLSFGLGDMGRRRLEAFDPDIIHVATPDVLGHEALALGGRLGRPVVASYHTRYETYLRFYGLSSMQGVVRRHILRFYGACREVYAPSPSMIEELTTQGLSGNVRLWARGVDTNRFTPEKRSSVWRRSNGIGDDEVVVAFVGRLVREKRLGTLADALRRLRAGKVRVRPLIVGDGPERTALRSLIADALFTGHLDGEALARAYAAADVFAFPSDTETFGNVTLEAMASGLATVCADATGSRSLVDPGVTGFLAPAHDGAAFADALGRLAADGGLRARMGLAARARSLKFSWNESMAGLLSRYEALAAA